MESGGLTLKRWQDWKLRQICLNFSGLCRLTSVLSINRASPVRHVCLTSGTGVAMDAPQIPIDPGVDLGRLLGQRRAFAAVGGRCSAAHAQLLRRIHDEKLFRASAPSWQAFCGAYLAITRRHADR